MPADWKGFINSFSDYLTSKVEKTPQKNADKLIDLYLDALSNKARPLPGTALFNKNDPKVISAKVALKESFSKAMEMMLKDPDQQKLSFDNKKKDKSFFDPATFEAEQTIPTEPPSGADPLPQIDPKYYDEIIANSSQTFFIKQKDGPKSNKIFDFKTRVDLTLPEGYGIPLSIFGSTIDEIIETLKAYTYLPGLLKLISYNSNSGYDLVPDINKKGVATTYGELIRDFLKLYAKGGDYRQIGDAYRSATGSSDENLSAAINSELGIIIKLYTEYELKEWLEIAKPYIEKTAKDKAIEEIKKSQNIQESQKIEGEDSPLNQNITDQLATTIIDSENDPYSIMAKSLVLFWTAVGTGTTTLFSGATGVPPSTIAIPNTYQIVFPGLPFIVAKGFKKAFNVGVNPKFIPEITFLQYQANPSAAIKKIDDSGKLSAKATSTAIAAVFATHLLTVKFIYFGQIPAAPSPIPAPSFVFGVF
jgi:hypothetical protein